MGPFKVRGTATVEVPRVKLPLGIDAVHAFAVDPNVTVPPFAVIPPVDPVVIVPAPPKSTAFPLKLVAPNCVVNFKTCAMMIKKGV